MKNVRKYLALPVTAFLLVLFLLYGISTSAEDHGGVTDTVTVVINYYYFDEAAEDHKGSAPYRPFVANMRIHSPEIAEKCPVIPGYKPYSLSGNESDGTGVTEYKYTPSVTLNFEKNKVYDIFYKPADVTYSIKLMKQDLNGSGYTVGKTIYGTGLTGEAPEEFADGYIFPETCSDPTLRGRSLNRAFDGFTMMYYQPAVIAADGSTEFECRYDRNYYNISFNLGEGGFGVSPLYVPYGFLLSGAVVGTPQRPGFVFDGWEPPLEPEVTCNKIYTAKWREDIVPVSIVYKTADVKQEGKELTYSYWGNADLLLSDGGLLNRTDYQLGDAPRAGDRINSESIVSDYSDAKARSLPDAEYYEFDLQTTLEKNDFLQAAEDINHDGKIDGNDVYFNVKGSGNNVITLYYSRKTYTLRFAYARQLIYGENLEGRGDIYISNRTNDGKDKNSGTGSGGVEWKVKVKSVPEPDTVEGGRVFRTTFDKSFYYPDGTVINTYRYYCLAFTAEYGEDIEQIWPADMLGVVYSKTNAPYRFGSWSSPAGSVYRNVHSEKDHANIIGRYPTMSSELMIDHDSNNTVPEKDAQGNEYGPVFYAWWGGNDANIGYHAYEIYYETVDEDEAEAVSDENKECIGGVTFVKKQIYFFHCAHNNGTRVDPFIYEGVTIIDSEKDGYSQSHDQQGHEKRIMTVTENGQPITTEVWVTKFHYMRKKNTLYFENMGSNGFEVPYVPYGQKLSKVKPVGCDSPAYPASILAPNKYEFGGWYTSMQFFTDDFRVDWDSMKMPDRAMKLYAYWKPRTFTVTFYNDEVRFEAGDALTKPYQDLYGEKIKSEQLEEIYQKLQPAPFVLPDGTVGQCIPVGWYYRENGVEHAFDPATMTVFGNMHLYMKWSSEVPTGFTISYADSVTGEKISEDTGGYSFVGLTRTFHAKVDNELRQPDNINMRYYPFAASTSVLMQSDSAKNVRVMKYAMRGNVPYRVRYVCVDENGNEVPAAPDKCVKNNRLSIVTERFRHIEKYIPQMYYSTLTLTVSDEYNDEHEDDPAKWNPANVITFYYIRDEVNMPFHVRYMAEDDVYGTEVYNGLKYKEIGYINDIGKSGDNETEPLPEYAGYTPHAFQEFVLTGSDVSYQLKTTLIQDGQTGINFILDDMHEGETVVGKEVHIYYNKKSYPVKISYTFRSSVVPEDAEPQAGETLEAAKERARQAAVEKTKQQAMHWCSLLESIYSGALIGGTENNIYISGSDVSLTVYRIEPDKKLGSEFEDTAPDLYENGISFSGGNRTRSIVISDDEIEPEKILKNRIDYFYTASEHLMIYYKVVIPNEDGFVVCDDQSIIGGMLSVNQQYIAAGQVPDVPVTAKAQTPVYKFAGWYQNEACTEPVHDGCVSGEQNNTFKPEHSYAHDVSFYAKYDYVRGDLTITALPDETDSQSSAKMAVFGSEYFEYIIRGSGRNDTESRNGYIDLRVIVPAGETVTVKQLPIGSYTIEQTGWAWRYTPDTAKKTVAVFENRSEPEAAAVIFKEKLTNTKWLTNAGSGSGV